MFYFTLMLCSTLVFNFQCPFVLSRCFAFASLSRDSLAILSHTFTFVNPFFKLFLIFFKKSEKACKYWVFYAINFRAIFILYKFFAFSSAFATSPYI